MVRAWALPFLLALAVYELGSGAMVQQPGGDEPHYELEAQSLAFDGDRDLTNDYARRDRYHRFFPQGVKDRHAHHYGGDRRLISQHNVGLPVLLIPAAVVRAHWNPLRGLDPMRLELVLISALGACVLLSILRKLPPRAPPRIVYAAWAAVAFSLPVAAFASKIYPETVGVLLALVCLRVLMARRLTRGLALLSGVSVALMPWLHVRFVIPALMLAVALAARHAMQRRPQGRRHVATAAAWSIAPLVVSLAAMAVAFQGWYGSPSLGAPYTFPGHPTGSALFDASWLYDWVLGGLFSSSYGWLPYAPVHLLGLAGIVYMCWRYGRPAILGTLATAAYFVVIVDIGGGAGWSYPWRFELLPIVLIALPLLVVLRDFVAARWAFLPLAVLTWVFTLTGFREDWTLLRWRTPAGQPLMELASALGAVWPRFPVGARFPDAALGVAWSVLLLALAGLFVWLGRRRHGRREQARRMATPAPVGPAIG